MIAPTGEDVGRRVKYLDGTLGTLEALGPHYVSVRWDVRRRVDGEWKDVPSNAASQTAAQELEWADGPA